MRSTKERFQARLMFLEKLEKEKEKALKAAPEGSLRGSLCHGKVQYYCYKEGMKKNGQYIPAAQRELAQKLAQKEYDEKVLQAASAEKKAIQKYLASCPDICAESIYLQISKAKKNLIRPIRDPDEVFVKKWSEKEYQGKGISESSMTFQTDRGETVRSKTELIIANLLNKENIPYRYEYPIQLQGMGTVYPDFTILNIHRRKEIIWEHFGMMDDPEYAEKAVRKLAAYQKSGFFPGENLIATWETRLFPIDIRSIQQLVQKYAG